MKLRSHSANCNEVVTLSGARILFSYSTPVAAWIPDTGFVRTSSKYSITTTKHINRWLDGATAQVVPQSLLNALN